jgi:hypothetical protein
VEYSLNVEQSGGYDLSFLSALGSGSGPQRTITATFTKGVGMPYALTDPVAVSPTGGWTDYQPTDATQVALEAGEQVLRITFNGGSQNLASFQITRDLDVSAASFSTQYMMLTMLTDTHDGSYSEEEVVVMSEEVNISGVQQDDQGVWM